MAVDLTGREILGYTVAGAIGDGGMATVWRAEHPTLGLTAALKVLDPMLARDKALVGRFADEARLQVQLRHDHIVRVENFTTDPPAMLMEFVEGDSLADVIRSQTGPIPFRRALPLMRQILSAVAFAHQHGVVHRDLKPANVLVTSDGTAKVTDFGIAKIVGGAGRTRTGITLGTPAYMAPEQVQGAKYVDERADVYALGVTFYEILAGRPPFQGDTETQGDFAVMQAQVATPPPDPRTFYAEIPGPVVDVLFTALAKAPEQRF